jgi:hypothetical protein
MREVLKLLCHLKMKELNPRTAECVDVHDRRCFGRNMDALVLVLFS